MPVTRGEIKGKVLRLLMKTAGYTGAYQEETIDDAIQEAFDFLATDMFEAGEGWLTKLKYIDTQAGQLIVPIPDGVACIQQVRYLFGPNYIPLDYNDASKEAQYSDDSGARQWASQYRIIDNSFYFNPPLAEGGTAYLQLECMEYPKRLQDDRDFVESQFDFAMQHFVKYRAATILSAGIEKFATAWAGMERDWYLKCKEIIVRRNRQAVPVRDFLGY
jgi:hypothetical protein